MVPNAPGAGAGPHSSHRQCLPWGQLQPRTQAGTNGPPRAAGTSGLPSDPRAAFPADSALKVLPQEEAAELPGALLLLAAQVPRLPRGRRAGAGAAVAPGRAVPAPGCPAGGDRGRCSAAAAAEGTEALFSPVNKGTIAAPPGHCSPPARGQRAPSRPGPGGQRLRRARGSGVSPDNLPLSRARPPRRPHKAPACVRLPTEQGLAWRERPLPVPDCPCPGSPQGVPGPPGRSHGPSGPFSGPGRLRAPSASATRVGDAAGASALLEIGTAARAERRPRSRSGSRSRSQSPSRRPHLPW